ncbi:hypothetical protein PENTCL1PPCAC_29231, partial [Pristionchus entomophagus]
LLNSDVAFDGELVLLGIRRVGMLDVIMEPSGQHVGSLFGEVSTTAPRIQALVVDEHDSVDGALLDGLLGARISTVGSLDHSTTYLFRDGTKQNLHLDHVVNESLRLAARL